MNGRGDGRCRKGGGRNEGLRAVEKREVRSLREIKGKMKNGIEKKGVDAGKNNEQYEIRIGKG